MERMVFTHRFRAGSASRLLQDKIAQLEDDIIEAEKASLTLDIGGYFVFMSASMEIEVGEDRSPSGAYYDETPDIFYKIDLKGILLKGINSKILRWKAELIDKYSEYNKLIKQL